MEGEDNTADIGMQTESVPQPPSHHSDVPDMATIETEYLSMLPGFFSCLLILLAITSCFTLGSLLRLIQHSPRSTHAICTLNNEMYRSSLRFSRSAPQL